MSEHSNKENLYHIPTPDEYLRAVQSALNDSNEENWSESVDIAQRNLVALGDWMGSHLLFSQDEPCNEEDYEPIPPGTLCGGLVPKYKTKRTPGDDGNQSNDL